MNTCIVLLPVICRKEINGETRDDIVNDTDNKWHQSEDCHDQVYVGHDGGGRHEKASNEQEEHCKQQGKH